MSFGGSGSRGRRAIQRDLDGALRYNTTTLLERNNSPLPLSALKIRPTFTSEPLVFLVDDVGLPFSFLGRSNFNGSYFLCSSSKNLVQDFYLAPYACAEVGFLHLEEGDLDQAKEFLNRARYKRESSPFYVMVLKHFRFQFYPRIKNVFVS